jgi:putative glutamine amidotransferase
MRPKTRTILLTTRVDAAPRGGEIRDGIDQALVRFLADLGFTVVIVPNDPVNLRRMLRVLPFDGAVLSGGNDIEPARYLRRPRKAPPQAAGSGYSPSRDETELALVAYCRQRRIPLVGVCRGLQLLNVALGGTLTRDIAEEAGNHVAIQHSIRLTESIPLPKYRGKSLKVNSYHRQGVLPSDLAPGAVALALSGDGVIEALRHPTLPLFGIQWHPERKGSPSAFDRLLFRHVLKGKGKP